MENHELIIPARFDSRDAAAGLRAIDESGHAAGDLGQAADAASARFRKAHESVTAASQEYLRLRRALQQAAGPETQPTSGGVVANEAIRKAGAKALSEKWLESGEGLGAAGTRLGDPGARPADEWSGMSQQQASPLRNTGEPAFQHDVGRAGLPPDGGLRGMRAESVRSSAGGPIGQGEEGLEGDLRLRATAGAWNRGPGGEPGTDNGAVRPEASSDATNPLRGRRASSGDLETFLEGSESLANVRRRPDPGSGSTGPGKEPGGAARAGRMGREAADDYLAWTTGGSRDASPEGSSANRLGGTAATDITAGARVVDVQVLRGGAEARHNVESRPEGLDPRERTWGGRGSSAGAVAADDSLADGPMIRPGRGKGWTPSGDQGLQAQFGDASTGVIEKLLREQNELIRQDLQRNTSHPIAAPPPMRGGGIRM